VFGVGGDSARDGGRGLQRGAELDTYLAHGRCARHVAERLHAQERRFSRDALPRVSYYVDEELMLSPGSSLYLFSRRVPVLVPLRWLLQCVVWARDASQGVAGASWEGGVRDGWVAMVLAGRIDVEVARCANWEWNTAGRGATRMSLKRRLLTARQLFTVVEQDDDDIWTVNTITSDVDTAVGYALEQLGARGRPELWCAGVKAGAAVLTADTPAQALERALTVDGRVDLARPVVVRWGTLEANLSVGQYNKEILLEENNPVAGPDFSVYRAVREWLVGAVMAGDWTKLTLKQLLEENAVKERDPELTEMVNDTETHWSLYEFASLDDIAFRAHEVLGDTSALRYDAYVSGEACERHARKGFFLREAEFGVRGAAFLNCSEAGDFAALGCETLRAGVVDYFGRRALSQPFLRRRELLFLVLVLVQSAMRNLVVGGVQALHVPRSGWQAATELFADGGLGPPLDPLNLAEVEEINALMQTLSESGVECKGASVDLSEVTNVQHLLLEQCERDLREEVGWVLPGRAGGGAHVLALPVPARLLLGGFYPAFAVAGAGGAEAAGAAGAARPADTFLRDLLGATSNADAPLGGRVCFGDEEEDAAAGVGAEQQRVHVMHPFWGEFFDVAHAGSAVMEEGRRARGCDMKRSGADNSLLVFSTLCGETTAGEQDVCALHPHYLAELRRALPEECEALDGTAVHRAQIGVMRGAPLCERQPDTGRTACERTHGLLHGRQGRPAEGLESARAVEYEQAGLWRRENTLFRGEEDAALAEEATALRLLEHDIGGHRMHFRLSADGVLRLDSVLMGSAPAAGARAPAGWLAEAEADFAEQHRLYEFAHAPGAAPAAGVSWRCPLHWLQTFVSDEGHDQARSPVAARNEARFSHITGPAHFAHPTVQYSSRVGGLRAAHFLSDGLACVGERAECRGAGLLLRSLDALVSQQDQWRVVEYVGAEKCARVLDWPDLADAEAARP